MKREELLRGRAETAVGTVEGVTGGYCATEVERNLAAAREQRKAKQRGFGCDAEAFENTPIGGREERADQRQQRRSALLEPWRDQASFDISVLPDRVRFEVTLRQFLLALCRHLGLPSAA